MSNDVTITDAFVFFWGGWPSQWHPCSFEVENIRYNCAEQFMMAEKARVFGDPEAEAAIISSTDPSKQKSLGRRVRGFSEQTWNSVCRGVVFRGNLAKFQQIPSLRAMLLNTGRRVIVEASPRDAIWGIGLSRTDPRALDPAQWPGSNWLGIAIMQARSEIRRAEGESEPSMPAELSAQLDARDRLRGVSP